MNNMRTPQLFASQMIASHAKKQSLGETLIILTNFMEMGHALSIEKKDEEGKRVYRQMAGMLFKAMLSVEPNRVMFAETEPGIKS
jgi:hypothetical protein